MSQMIWLVTGCSSGFGEELVKSIMKRGDKAIATARGSVDRLKHLRDLGAATMELDVTSDQETLNGIVRNALAIYGDIDILVNNAGYIEAGLLEDLRYDNPRSKTFGMTKALLTCIHESTRSVCSRT